MTHDALLLVGREANDARQVLETHADRLLDRGVATEVVVATYADEPGPELRDQLRAVTADRVFAVPMAVAHTHDTVDAIPAALSYVPGDVHYCEPLGRSPALTDALVRRAADRLPPRDDVSLIVVAFGSSSKPYFRQTAEYHAARIREGTDFGEVVTCFLLQNPAAECVRYTVSGDRAVAVPLFLARSPATEREIPEKLELDRGSIEYAAPLGGATRVTDAIHAEVERQRVLTGDDDGGIGSFEATLTAGRRPVVTDGDGVARSGTGATR